MASTKERLAADLRVAGLGELADRAALGEFDDYESEHADPQMRLVLLLRAAGRNDFAKRIIAGEYDGSEAEATAWYLLGEILP